MEITCSRCHQTIPFEGLYCPSCGLPQLQYASEDAAGGPAQAERWENAVREVGEVEWRPALRAALMLSVPAGLLFGVSSELGFLGLFWVAAAAAWAVTLYARWQRSAQRPAWLTAGAGARIGLVTGLICGWVAFAATGLSLYASRFLLHQGKDYDDGWQAQVAKVSEQWQTISASSQDPQMAGAMAKTMTSWLLSPEGKAGSALGALVLIELFLVIFAVAGGALGTRFLARPARTRE